MSELITEDMVSAAYTGFCHAMRGRDFRDVPDEDFKMAIRQALGFGLARKPQPDQPAAGQARIMQLEDCLRHIGMDLEMLGLNTEDVEAALGGKPQAQAEPVAELKDDGDGMYAEMLMVNCLLYKPGMKLYTHPAPREAVPENPTEKMLVAARDWSAAKYGKPIGNDAAIGCWQVMLAAAPKHGGEK